MSDQDKTDEDIEIFDMIEFWGGGLVVLGLIAEVAYAFLTRSGKLWWVVWTPVIANGLVAGGVIVEIAFARLASTRRDSKILRLTRDLTNALDRAAMLEKQQGPRLVNPVQLAELIKPVEPVPVEIVFPAGQLECQQLAFMLYAGLTGVSKWPHVKMFQMSPTDDGIPVELKMGGPGMGLSVLSAAKNDVVRVAFHKALKESMGGIPWIYDWSLEANPPIPGLKIAIAPKP